MPLYFSNGAGSWSSTPTKLYVSSGGGSWTALTASYISNGDGTWQRVWTNVKPPTSPSATDASFCSGDPTYQVNLGWASSPTWYTNIYNNGVFIITMSPGVSSYTDTSLGAPGSYSYTFREYDGDTESADSIDAPVTVVNPCL